MKKLFVILLSISINSFAQSNDGESVKEMFKAGQQAFQSGDLATAKTKFLAATKQDVKLHEGFTNLAIINYMQGDYQNGVENAEKALALKPNSTDANLFLGKSNFKLGNYKAAKLNLEKAIAGGLKTGSSQSLLGWTNYSLNKYEEALVNFNSSIALDKNNNDAYRGRAKVYSAQGDFENATADLQKLIDINPEDKNAYLNLVQAYYTAGDSVKADALIIKRSGSADAKDKIDLLLVQGNYYFKQNNLEAAKKAFNSAYTLDKKNVSTIVNQSGVLIAESKYKEAVVKVNEAIAIDDEVKEAYFNRGIANEMLRNVYEACSDWETAFILGSLEAEKYLNSAICNE